MASSYQVRLSFFSQTKQCFFSRSLSLRPVQIRGFIDTPPSLGSLPPQKKMPTNHKITTDALPPHTSLATKTDGHNRALHTSDCHGLWHDAVLVVFSVGFVVYLALHTKKNVKKLWNRRSYIVISYYALLWLATLFNLGWSSLQAWQCSPRKEAAWNVLSLFTTSGMLCLEISLLAFLLQEDYTTGLDALAHNLVVSGIVVGVDMLLKVIYVFGFGVPLFIDGVESSNKVKWGLWIIHKLLVTAVYGFILFVHFSKWRDKLPPRPAFYNYIVIMFVVNAVALFACGLAGFGAGLGIWLYNLTVVCYHSFYLPFLYITFLADFFQENDFLLENAYYSEMKDAGFFDADWD